MLLENRLVTFSHQNANAGIGEKIMEFFYQAGCKNGVTDKSGLNDQNIFIRRQSNREWFLVCCNFLKSRLHGRAIAASGH